MDPISPYLFILCSGLFTLAVINEEELEGLKIYDKEHKISHYVYDTSMFVKARTSLNILKWFHIQNGLKVDISKTKVKRTGKKRERHRWFCGENNLDWMEEFTALGIAYDMRNLDTIIECNVNTK